MATYEQALIAEEGNRSNRIQNIAIVLQAAIKAHDGGPKEYVTKEVVLKAIRKTIPKPDGMDEVGDARAHGDACGGHGLSLKMEGRGSSTKIWLSSENLSKCTKFLEAFDEINAGLSLEELSKI